MPEPDLIALFVGPLEELGVRYLVSGSVAAMLYGEPRITHDVDLIVFLREPELAALARAFPPDSFYLPPEAVIRIETGRDRHGHFNVIHHASGLKADFYTAGQDPFHAWAFRHARQYPIGGLTVRVAPIEYVIVRKLEYFREGGSDKHVRDIRGMLRLSGDLVDAAALDEWIAARQVQTEWRHCSQGP